MKFIVNEMPQGDRWMVGIDDAGWVVEHKIQFHSSFNVLGARLLGLSYADYLRYLQSKGADLKGKQGYAYPYFKDKAVAQRIATMLNKRWAEFLTYVKKG